MKFVMLVSALLVLSAGALRARENDNPVSRVAQLLTDLASKIDSELDAETDLYEKYVCWAKTVISSKTASNDKAQSRTDTLKTYLADLDAGRIELTTERSDMEKEVSQLNDDLEKAAALREKENTDYKAATAEMKKGIKALESAVKVLGDATKDSKGSFVSLRARIQHVALDTESEGFSTRVEEADSLQTALTLGSKYLKPGDALFLQRLLSGDVEVPQKDWKKLNRKADFKMKYKMRSGKIQDILSKLLKSFKGNLADADDTEDDALKTYKTLKEAKEKQLKTSADSLAKQLSEGGAAGVSKADAQAEIDALDTQITDDKKYIKETEDALADKKKEFVERKNLRVAEIAAINEAKSVIHSDDARDLFKKTATSFLQINVVSSSATAMASAAIRHAATASGDLRLSALAARIDMSTGGKFTKVIKAVDSLITELEDDGKKDTKDKKECEDDRKDNTKESADTSRDIDDLSDDITKLEGDIKQINKDIEEKEKTIADTKQEMKEAKRMREDQNTEWKANDADDSAAIKLLEKSAGVLKTFYKDNFSLLSTKVQNKLPEVEAGKAPPPPPSTFSGGYGGAQKEQTGIVGILETIKSDIEADQTDAKKAEDKSQADYDTFKSESEDAINKLEKGITGLEDSRGDKQVSIQAKKKSTNSKKKSLASVIKQMKAVQPGCDFLLVNFKIRTDNRKLEMDGLKTAKGILEKENK